MGPWCTRRMVSLPPGGPNKGFRHRAPTKRLRQGHEGHKNTLPITHIEGVRQYDCLCVTENVMKVSFDMFPRSPVIQGRTLSQ